MMPTRVVAAALMMTSAPIKLSYQFDQAVAELTMLAGSRDMETLWNEVERRQTLFGGTKSDLYQAVCSVTDDVRRGAL